ncbi:MAG TPA: hypothetical protein VE988_25560 [Gemmataceae bacterium]|nr:hypothetical protein [Gemmataceae bacterium]
MAYWLTVDAACDRVITALSFIIEGRAVGFPGFGLAVSDGVFRIDVEYPSHVPNDDLGQEVVNRAIQSVDKLIETESAYAAALSHLPRRIALVYSDKMGEVEVARVSKGAITWIAADRRGGTSEMGGTP